jgi:GT2 family glycosyltransferase
MLESLHNQKNVKFEVLVIDQSDEISQEKINKIIISCHWLRYFHINEKGRSLSKNFAIDNAKYNIILFCDDDIIVDEYFLEEHVRLHGLYRDVGAISCHLIEPHENEIQCKIPLKITKYGRFINKPNALYNGYVTSLNGGNMSFKSSALKKVGYFEENYLGTSMLEEPDIAYRLQKSNYKLYFSSNSKVKHFPQYNGNINIRKGKNFRWQRDYFINQYFFMFRNKRTGYFPLIFIYLVYRTIIDSIENKNISLKYLLLPFTSFNKALIIWKEQSKYYKSNWYTSRKNVVSVSINVEN